MKDLIERLDAGFFCREEASEALKQQAAVIEVMTILLNKIHDTAAPYDDGVKFRYIKEMALEALALQPCPEVLAKVKADARREGMLEAAEICKHGHERGIGAKYQGDVFAEAIREAAK